MRGVVKHKKIIALSLLICVVMLSLLSEAFIGTYEGHEHDFNGVGGSCAVCSLVNNAENLLKNIGMAVSFIPAVLIGLFSVIGI